MYNYHLFLQTNKGAFRIGENKNEIKSVVTFIHLKSIKLIGQLAMIIMTVDLQI